MCTDLHGLHCQARTAELRTLKRGGRLVGSVSNVVVMVAVCLGLATSACAGFTDVVDQLGPVAWWRLGEDRGPIAAAASGDNGGEYFGDPTLGEPGAVVGDADTSVFFDELDDYVEIPDFSYSDDTGQFSLAFLFSIDSGDGGFRYAVSHGDFRAIDSFNVWFCEGNSCDDLFDDVPGAGAGNLRVNVTNDFDNNPFVDVGVEFADEQWHLFTMTVSGADGLTVYVDGDSVAGDPDFVTEDPFDPDFELNLGRRSDANADRYFFGNLDEVMLFDYPLSELQVSALAAARTDTGSQLQAGDADQDLDFDQLDLVQVQVAAKYLTGQVATWGDGDWDGAPGGEPGNPPTGNGRFDQLDIIAALAPGHYLTGPYAAVKSHPEGDGHATLVYDPNSGRVEVQAGATQLTSINIDSAAGIFTGEPAQNLGGSFDNDADGNIFKATFGSSFGSLSFGNVAQMGLSEQFVLGDLTVVGSLAGGGDLGEVDLIYVPEPSSLLLALVGFVGLLQSRLGRCWTTNG